MTNGLSIDEIMQLEQQLNKLEPGKLPLSIFSAVARLTVMPIVEIVPVRQGLQGVEVMLIERDLEDPIWPGMLHTPGTVIRANDEEGSFIDAFSRIQNELGEARMKSPIFVETRLHRVKRGMELANIYYAEVESNANAFYPAGQFPAKLVDTQKEFIANAVKAFEVRSKL